MTQDSKIDRLHDIVDRMLGRTNPTLTVARLSEPFDTTPQNQHSSKQAFLEEKRRVVSSVGQARSVLEAVWMIDKEVEAQFEAVDLIEKSIDAYGRKAAHEEDVSSAQDLILQTALQNGFYDNAILSLIRLYAALMERSKDLDDQEKEFWSDSHRPPNHYARTIALRLARLYARETSEFPTVGVARDGGHPSTAFTKALEEVFDVLGIKTRPRRPAEWAVTQLTEDDLAPFLSGIGLGSAGRLGAAGDLAALYATPKGGGS